MCELFIGIMDDVHFYANSGEVHEDRIIMQ